MFQSRLLLHQKNIAAAIIENDERTTEKFAQNLINAINCVT